MKKFSVIMMVLMMAVVFSATTAFAYPALPDYWKLKFENFEMVTVKPPGTNLADGVEDSWGILKMTSIIDRLTTNTTWSDGPGSNGWEITGIYYGMDVDEVYQNSPTDFDVNISNVLMQPQLDLYIQNTGDVGYTAFDPTQGPGGRLTPSTYNGVTDGTLLVSLLFMPGVLLGGPDAADTAITLNLDALTSPLTGQGAGYLDVVFGSGDWADQINLDVFLTSQGLRDVFFELDLRDHPDVGLPDWGWDNNSDDPSIGNAIPEPGTLILLGAGLLGLGGLSRRKRKK